MSRQHCAKLRWLSAAEGGRSMPFDGQWYSSVARFPAAAEEWSITATFAEGSGEHEVEAVIALLSPHAPDYLVSPGAVFEILEGDRVVAIGHVIE